MSLALALLLTCTACSQEDAPAEDIAKAVEEIVAPAAKAAAVAKGEWAPRDECRDIEGADQFRQQLADAVEARDADALVALADDGIDLDFGGGFGTAELRARLDGGNRDLWGELDELLQLGCATNEEGEIVLPWIFEQDYGDMDFFDAMLVIGEDVPVFEEESTASRRVETVSWDVLEMAPYEQGPRFMQVKLPDGKVGFVEQEHLRALADYRLFASRLKGRWRITAFIAGD
jgi:hypothetical protein